MAGNKEFANRRLHSLLGVIPVGLFLIEHLIANFMATKGADSFNAAVHFLESIPFRYFLEIFVIFLPLLYHAIYGLYIAFTAKNNVSNYGYFRNWMFLLQRVSGVLTLIFIAWHVWETRIAALFGQTVEFSMMTEILSNPAMMVFYIIGVVSAIFHFANGLWSFLVSWGITVTPRSQRISTFVTIAVFVGLTYVGMRALFAFVNPELAGM